MITEIMLRIKGAFDAAEARGAANRLKWRRSLCMHDRILTSAQAINEALAIMGELDPNVFAYGAGYR